VNPRPNKPVAKVPGRGGWSGGPVKDNPGERRLALLAVVVGTLLVAGVCLFIAYH
jgi:hypothetical protein